MSKKFLIALGVLVVVGAGLWQVSVPDGVVPATVTDDPSLPAVEVGGIRLHAETKGPIDAPVVIALHGGPGDDYKALLPLEGLSDQFRIVFYDQRGAGLSERVPPEQLTLDHYVEELDGVIAQSGSSRVHLLGHSWGAMLATAYISRHPDKVESAILIEPGFLTPEASEPFVAAMSDLQLSVGLISHLFWTGLGSMHISGPDPDARLDFFLLELATGKAIDGHPMGRYFCDEDVGTAHLPHWRFGSTASSTVQQSMGEDGRVQLDLASGLETFDGPVLLVAGSCNTLIGEAHQREFHLPLFADAELVVVDGAGHTLIGEKPEASLRLFRDFLGRDAGGPSEEEAP